MSAMSELDIERLEDMEALEIEKEEMFWELYDEFLEERFEGIPLEEIPEAESYLRRHLWDYIFFVDMMSAPNGDWEELIDKDWCKRDFLIYVIYTQADSNCHVNELRNAIYNYIKDNHMDLLFPDR